MVYSTSDRQQGNSIYAVSDAVLLSYLGLLSRQIEKSIVDTASAFVK